jgi:hypothetical protein
MYVLGNTLYIWLNYKKEYPFTQIYSVQTMQSPFEAQLRN